MGGPAAEVQLHQGVFWNNIGLSPAVAVEVPEGGGIGGYRGGGRGGYGASVAEVGVLQVRGVGDLLRAASQVHLKAGG